jgi:hypothetical protein
LYLHLLFKSEQARERDESKLKIGLSFLVANERYEFSVRIWHNEEDIKSQFCRAPSWWTLYAHNSNCITLLRAMHESNSDVLTCSYEAVDEISSAESWQFDFARLKLLTRTFLLQISLEKVDLVLFTRWCDIIQWKSISSLIYKMLYLKLICQTMRYLNFSG